MPTTPNTDAARVLASLQECRDILCTLHARPESLPYLLGSDIPSAIKSAYTVLQRAGVPNAQEGGTQ